MSQQPAPPSPMSPPPFERPAERSLSQLALWSMILGIVGLCFGPLALAALIMGIIGITKTGPTDPQHGRGFAIAGTVLGTVGFFGTCLMLGILLPAIGKARQTAMTLMSEAQLRQIQSGMIDYRNQNGTLPPADEWRAALSDYLVMSDEPVFVSPLSDGDAVEYVFVPGDDYAFNGRLIMFYEDPDHITNNGMVIVGYDDGRVARIDVQTLAAELAARGHTLQR